MGQASCLATRGSGKWCTMQTEKYKTYHKQFVTFLEVRNYKTSSKTTYSKAVRKFLTYLEGKGVFDVSKAKQAIMLDFLNDLQNAPSRLGGTLSVSFINHHLNGIRLFVEYLLHAGELKKSLHVPNNIKGKKEERTILSQEEIQELLNTCKNRRERSLLYLAYGCGLRRSELEQLNVEDLKLTSGSLIVREGKFGKRRDIPLTEQISACLKDYIVYERNTRLTSYHPAVFITRFGNRANGTALGRMLKRIIDRTNNPEIIGKNISLHSLRHCIASHLAENGADIDFIREFLGHSLIDTAQLYAIKNKQRWS